VVAAAALGLEAEREMEPAPLARTAPGPMAARLTIHQGTLRSGDHLQAEGSVLVLGDVNPGARITAGGHVLVWGRLRGVAHAGCHGDATARIMALQLRPLQLRIGAKVARGPQDIPPTGFAEEARLVDGVIQIDAADPQWPLIG
jgi:septum site-determining protein MinC